MPDNIPPRIMAWLRTEAGWSKAVEILNDWLFADDVLTTEECLERIEAAYRRSQVTP